MAFLVTLAISIAINIIAYLITPKPKRDKPAAAKQLESPTASAGIEVYVVFGTVLIKSPNCLDWRDKDLHEYDVPA